MNLSVETSTIKIIPSLHPLIVPIADLHEDPSNARKGHAIDRIAASLKQYGQRKPIVVNRLQGNKVEAGNGTLAAAKSLGWTEIAAVFVEDDAATAAAYGVADNRVGELSSWDADILSDLMPTLDGLMTGFTDSELKAILPQRVNEGDTEPQIDKAEELRVKWGVESGQMWALGDHRIICGDCTDAAVVTRVMDGEKAVLMVTDPPYGIEHDTTWREEAGISSMGEQSAKGIEWDSNDNWSTAYKLGGADIVFVWHASSHNIIVAQSLADAGYVVKQMIIWNKSVAPFGRSHYSYKHEPCWYAVKKGKAANWHGPNNEVTVWDGASPRHIMGGSTEEKTPHPTQKPLFVYERPIANHTEQGEAVFEPFSGSGTSIIACENLGRKCRAIEISPGYVAVAIERWAQHTGREPELVS